MSIDAQTTVDNEPARVAVFANPERPSRAERMAHPLTLDAYKQLAASLGVCIRPVALRRTDLATGQTEVFDIRCGATRDTRCPGCARRAKRLRQQQCAQGWHRDDEPLPPPEASPEQTALLELRATFEYLRADALAKAQWAHVAELDQAIGEVERDMRASGLRGQAAQAPRDGSDVHAATITQAGQITATVGSGGGDSMHGAATTAAIDTGPSSLQVGPGPRPDNDTSTDPDTAGPPDPGGGAGRRVRSTRRRQDAPDLPRRRVEPRTIGRTFEGRAGAVFRPSTFVTLTLPSYGRVREDGSPLDPTSYDYRRAAWDAVHFPALLDRLWQNLRRAVGWNVQYFGAVEPQRRGAPHAHFAVRGAIARAVIRQVVQATYQQVWWPSTAVVHYPAGAPQPVWDEQTGGYRDPDTGQPLPSWEQALDELDQVLDDDPDRGPEHVVRFGEQLDLQGVLAGTDQARQRIRYLTKYLTKSVTDCHPVATETAAAHRRRFADELRYTPCSARCPNWLRYGITPKGARAKLVAGFCRGKVHQLDTLGIGGRRVLVSRQWSGKTLADHRHDQAAWVRRLLAGARTIADDIDEETAAQIDAARAGGAPAPVAWELARPGDPDVPDLARRLMRAIAAHQRHRAAIDAAQAADPPGDRSAARSP